MKRDFLKECMSEVGNMPLDHFNVRFCTRCLNKECSRSAGNQQMFTKRAENWKETLFTNVARASDEDPRYEEIRAKRFISKEPPLGNVVLTEPEPDSEESAPVEAPMPTLKPEPPAIATVPPPIIVERQPVAQSVANTPFQQGMMLEGAKQEKIIPAGGVVILDDD